MSDFRVPQNDSNPLELLFKLQALKQQREADANDAQRETLRTALSIAGAGGDITSLLGRLDPATAQALQSASEAQRGAQANEAFQSGVQPQAVAPFVGAVAPTIDQTGNIIQAPPEAQQQARDNYITALRARGVPEDRMPAALAIFDSNVTAESRAAQDKRDQERRTFGQQDALSKRSADREEARAKRAEERMIAAEQRKQEDAAVDEYATTLSASALGYLDPRANTELANQVLAQYGDRAPEVMTRITRLAQAKQAGFQTEIQMKESANTANVKAFAQSLGTTESNARMVMAGNAIIDPVFDEPGHTRIIPITGGQTAAAAEMDRRSAIADSIGQLNDLESSFDKARRAGAGGPIIGGDDPQNFLRAVGAQQPEASEYITKMQFFVKNLIRASKDPRPSDFDIRYYLAMVPNLNELYSGSAEGRFKGLEDSLRLQAQAPYDRGIATQIRERRDNYTPEDRQMERAFDDFSSGKLSYEQFDAQLQSWKMSRGRQFVMPGVGADANDPGAAAVREKLKRYGIGGP